MFEINPQPQVFTHYHLVVLYFLKWLSSHDIEMYNAHLQSFSTLLMTVEIVVPHVRTAYDPAD